MKKEAKMPDIKNILKEAKKMPKKKQNELFEEMLKGMKKSEAQRIHTQLIEKSKEFAEWRKGSDSYKSLVELKEMNQKLDSLADLLKQKLNKIIDGLDLINKKLEKK